MNSRVEYLQKKYSTNWIHCSSRMVDLSIPFIHQFQFYSVQNVYMVKVNRSLSFDLVGKVGHLELLCYTPVKLLFQTKLIQVNRQHTFQINNCTSYF